MKKKLLIALFLLISIAFSYQFFTEKEDVKKVRENYAKMQKEHPFSKTLQLTKKERKAQGIPPNKYYEEKYLLEMNPHTGRTHPENVYNIREELKAQRLNQRAPGDGVDDNWEERGPNNVGGRTRAVLFDPNDATHKRVFAGGVSGGLWVNNDITDENSSWTQVGIDENLSVTCIAVDPNNSQIMYVGTGELYTNNDALGNGVWRSMDGGATWTNVYRVRDNTVIGGTQNFVPGTYYTTDIVVRDADGNSATTNDSEVFVAVGANYYAGSPATFLGVYDYGIFKSTDTGTNWNRVTLNSSTGSIEAVNDFEISSDNTLWVSTTRNVYGNAGGSVYSSTDGSTFTLKHTVPNARRTEIALSKTDANKIYVLAQLTTDPVGIYLTTDGFATAPSALALPDDVDTGIPANDFTRGQAFYDLMLEVDPNNDAIAYVGGINLFRTADSGTSWTQISKWSNNNDLATLNVPLVHADQHGWAFHPTNSDIAVNGNDGGVYYASSLSAASSSTTAISARNKDYNVTQFYKGSIGQGISPEYLLAGAQDNGTQFVNGASSGVNGTIEVFGGDGGFCFIDKDESYMIVSYVYNNIVRLNLPYDGTGIYIGQYNTGDFINPMDLDDNFDILYTKWSSGQLARFINVGGTPTGALFTHSLLSNISTIKVSPYTTASSTIFVGSSDGTLTKVENANTDSINLTNISGGSFLGSVSAIEFGANEDEILVTFHNFGVTSVWYTSDGGTSWANKEGDLPDIPVKAIIMNPLNNDEVIIGTELGVWKTANFKDASPAWTASYNGMSNVAITSFDVRTSDYTILASTYGRGMFTGKFILAGPIWTGAVSTDWKTAGNWDTGMVPTATDDVSIPSGGNQPIINSAVSLNNLFIENGASLTINAEKSLTISENLTNSGTLDVNGGALVVSGNSTGNITYHLDIADTNWYFASSPVIGQQYDDAWIMANGIASGAGNNRGISTYDNGTPDATTGPWTYFQAGDTGTFATGIGYGVLRTSAGTYDFTGTYPTEDTSLAISQDDNNWNLLGNPYPSYLNINKFIIANTSNFSGSFQAIYVWDGTSYNPLATGYLNPGQGFFVNSDVASGTVIITEAMQEAGVEPSGPGGGFRTTDTIINLTLSDDTHSKNTQINYLDGKTLGLDPGFDLGMFDGTSSSLRVYTHLIEDNEEIAFGTQALPNAGYESMIIPVGVKADAGKEITFSVEAMNLPTDVNIYLEDKEANIFTRLDEVNTEYTITLSEALDGVGRFYIHTSTQALGVSNVDLVSVSVYTTNQKIHFSGLPEGNTLVTLYDMVGKVILEEKITENTSSISIENISKGGIYLVHLKTEKGTISKKIVLQ